MGAAKEFLDLTADFLIFILGCAFAISGFANTTAVQNTLNNTLTDKGSAVVADAYPDVYVSGEEVIALLLLPDGLQSVEVDGLLFSSNIKSCLNYIYAENLYLVSRSAEAEGIKLSITTFVP